MLKLLAKWLFPDFSNRITWVVVSFGIALIATTLVNVIAEALFDYYLDFKVTDRNDSIVGLVLILLGLLHNLVYQFICTSKITNRLNPSYSNDTALFNSFVALIPSNPTIENLKSADFLAEVERRLYEPLRTFLNGWENSEHYFSNMEMELLRSEFMKKTDVLFQLIGKYTVPIGPNSEFASVRDKSNDKYLKLEERNRTQAEELNCALDAVISSHQALIKHGRSLYVLS